MEQRNKTFVYAQMFIHFTEILPIILICYLQVIFLNHSKSVVRCC